MQPVDQTHLGLYFYIPGEPKLVEASVLVLESTCEKRLALGSHYLENTARDASLGSCFLQRVPDLESGPYSLKLGECCSHRNSALCLHLISRSDRRQDFYYSESVRVPIAFGCHESGTRWILNTDFHHESSLPL